MKLGLIASLHEQDPSKLKGYELKNILLKAYYVRDVFDKMSVSPRHKVLKLEGDTG